MILADRDGVGITEKVSSVYSQDVLPATFLVDDTPEFASVVVPWRLRLAGETLDTAECRILRNGINEHCDCSELFLKPHLDGYCRNAR